MEINTTIQSIEKLVQEAQSAFPVLKNKNIKERAALMHLIADEIEALGEELTKTTSEETNLPLARLQGEQARTVFQWRSYADGLAAGTALPVRIDTAAPDRNPPKPDLRKSYVPLGIVVVFGASNFPYAYSTAGGDTASAIAAGCPVIVKAHPAHPRTSAIMGQAIARGIRKAGLPSGVFGQVFSDGFEAGNFLVSHPLVKAVGFTGSLTGGKALFDLAARRQEPIPVFAEMGSVNPVFLLPGKLKSSGEELAGQYIASLTLGVGQFCTNPGVLMVPENEYLPDFIGALREALQKIAPVPMLHQGIANNYQKNKQRIIGQVGVELIASVAPGEKIQGNPALVKVKAQNFLSNDVLAEEVFGPFGILVTYSDQQELLAVARKFNGQLTASLLVNDEELGQYGELVDILTTKCGRILHNGFPTGVEVAYAMQHGGPFPASTDSRFSAVGPDAIQRFARPISYQNWSDEWLPDELKNSNPLDIWRTINTEYTKEPI